MKFVCASFIKQVLRGFLVAAALVGLGCGTSATATPAPTQSPGAKATAAPMPSQAQNVVLRVGVVADTYRNDPKDPSRANVGMFPINANIFDQLTSVSPNFQLQPMLAESWEYLKETGAWRFRLRKDVKFHDGQPFTADSVVEMVKKYWSQGATGPRLRINESSAVARDPYTLDITPLSLHLRLPEELAHPSFGVRAPGSDPFLGGHIGSGPFKFVEYIKDDRIIFEKNSGYWGTVPRVDRIEFRFMPDPNTRVLALQAREVDVIYDVPPEATSLLQGKKDIQVLKTDVSASQYIMVLITGQLPYNITQDILVREALGYAIDRQQIIDTSFHGFASPNQVFGPVGVLGQYANRIVGYSYDPDRARSLLEKAGWKEGDRNGIREKGGRKLTLEFINGFPAGPENGTTAEVLQAQLRQVGIDLKIVNIPDNPAYSARLENKQGDLFLEIGNQNSPSPCFLANLFYGRHPNPGPYTRGFAPGPAGWPAYDDAIDACAGAITINEAAMHRADAIHVAVDEARVAIPLLGITRIYAARADVKAFTPHPVRLHVRWESISVTR